MYQVSPLDDARIPSWELPERIPGSLKLLRCHFWTTSSWPAQKPIAQSWRLGMSWLVLGVMLYVEKLMGEFIPFSLLPEFACFDHFCLKQADGPYNIPQAQDGRVRDMPKHFSRILKKSDKADRKVRDQDYDHRTAMPPLREVQAWNNNLSKHNASHSARSNRGISIRLILVIPKGFAMIKHWGLCSEPLKPPPPKSCRDPHWTYSFTTISP